MRVYIHHYEIKQNKYDFDDICDTVKEMSSLQFRGTRLDYAKCRLHMELGLQQRQP